MSNPHVVLYVNSIVVTAPGVPHCLPNDVKTMIIRIQKGYKFSYQYLIPNPRISLEKAVAIDPNVVTYYDIPIRRPKANGTLAMNVPTRLDPWIADPEKPDVPEEVKELLHGLLAKDFMKWWRTADS